MERNYNLKEKFCNCWNMKFKTVGDKVDYNLIKEPIEQNKYDLYIYFQCSLQLSDWLSNFAFWKRLRKRKPYKGMDVSYKVHSGFLDRWKQVEDIMREAFKDENINSINIVGYSHGAALAILCHECAWWCRPDLRNKLITFAFGAPRVYGSYFIKKSLKERWINCYIFRNKNDIVTHLPPIIFGYRHVGKLVKLAKADTYGIFSFIKAHFPENYYQAIASYEKFYNLSDI